MHVLMISMDAALLTESIGNSRARHEFYAEQWGRLSLTICTRQNLTPYESARVIARPTRSRSYVHYLLDGYRMGLRFHAEHTVDVIATQDPFLTALIGLALRRVLHVPLIIQDHSSIVDNPYFAQENRRNVALQRLGRWTLRQADAVRVVNSGERDACIRHSVQADRVCVVPVAPALSQFSVSPTPTESSTALWVGRMVTVKNVPLLLRAFVQVHAQIPAARLILAVNAENETQQGELTAQIGAFGLKDIVMPRWTVAHADLPALHHEALVCVHSSNYEGFGLVLAEAAASGLPAISTETDGARDIVIDGETGLLVPIGDATALAKALITLLSDPARARAMGIKARKHVSEHFDEHSLLMNWVEMVSRVAGGKPPCVS